MTSNKVIRQEQQKVSLKMLMIALDQRNGLLFMIDLYENIIYYDLMGSTLKYKNKVS